MPERLTKRRALRAKAEGKAPSTQAGEFVREEIEHVREGKHGARSAKQAIAIGLSKARRAGVNLPPPEQGKTSEKTRRSAGRAYARGHSSSAHTRPSTRRSNATRSALRRESRLAASHEALARQARQAASRRRPSDRSAAAKKGSRTKGAAARAAAAKRAARSRAARR